MESNQLDRLVRETLNAPTAPRVASGARTLVMTVDAHRPSRERPQQIGERLTRGSRPRPRQCGDAYSAGPLALSWTGRRWATNALVVGELSPIPRDHFLEGRLADPVDVLEALGGNYDHRRGVTVRWKAHRDRRVEVLRPRRAQAI